jgi:hypothetical protein
LFLGDSTVERAIDAEIFERRSGLTALNLGLTGNLGTYGDYAILKRYLSRLRPPRAVVVWHAIDVWGRDPEPQLLAFTQPDVRDTLAACRQVLRHWSGPKALAAAPVEAASLVVQNGLMRLPSYRYRAALKRAAGLSAGQPAVALGTVLPRRVIAEQIEQLRGVAFGVSPQSRFWFGEMVDLAVRHGAAVLAARSPLHEDFRGHPTSQAFVEESNRALDRLYASYPGVAQINRDNPVFRADQGYGDKDHVADGGREYLSAYYAERVALSLRDAR